MPSPEDTHYVTTEDELRALAHPLRLRLLGLLRVDGPATASGLGKRLGESSGVTSYHLRYLADRDFVEEAPELGNKRERWWRASQTSSEWNSVDFLDSREGRAADLAFRREVVRFTRAALDNWMIEETTWPREWIGAAAMSDIVLRLSVDQLGLFESEYRDLVARFEVVSDENTMRFNEAQAGKGLQAEADEANVDTERVFAIMHAFPIRELNP